jgi:hypothetical protein
MFPICYLIGFGSQILPFHRAGATCILMPHFEPRLVLEAIQTYRLGGLRPFREALRACGLYVFS